MSAARADNLLTRLLVAEFVRVCTYKELVRAVAWFWQFHAEDRELVGR